MCSRSAPACGYAAAVLNQLAAEVHSIERISALAEAAHERLQRLGVERVQVHHADGSDGWPAAAPYDAIQVTAAADQIPTALLDQLAIGGRLVIPVGSQLLGQELLLVRRRGDDDFRRESLAAVRFVPLLHGCA